MKWTLLVALIAVTCSVCHAAPSQLPAAAVDGIARGALTVPAQPDPEFGKEYIPYVFHEMIYFNKREADLEHHAFVRGRYMFLTLTDLCRHVGGDIQWGPRASFVEVTRKGQKVRFYPGSSLVAVDGQRQRLSRATFRINRLLYVPVRSVCDIFGCTTDWDNATRKAYVSFQN